MLGVFVFVRCIWQRVGDEKYDIHFCWISRHDFMFVSVTICRSHFCYYSLSQYLFLCPFIFITSIHISHKGTDFPSECAKSYFCIPFQCYAWSHQKNCIKIKNKIKIYKANDVLSHSILLTIHFCPFKFNSSIFFRNVSFAPGIFICILFQSP